MLTVRRDHAWRYIPLADKMTIVGTDGKAKFVLDENNHITDLRTYCSCVDTQDLKIIAEQPVCLYCELPIRIP